MPNNAEIPAQEGLETGITSSQKRRAETLTEQWLAPKTLLTAAIFVGFAYVYRFMLFNVSAEDNVWERLVFLFAVPEGLVAAGAGAILGTAVQVKRVNTAEREKDQAKEESQKHQEQETKYRTKAAVAITAGNGLRHAVMTNAKASQESKSKWFTGSAKAVRLQEVRGEKGQYVLTEEAEPKADTMLIAKNQLADVDPSLLSLAKFAETMELPTID